MGAPQGFFGFSYSITDRHEAAAALRASEEWFRIVTENLPGLIFDLDAELRYRMVKKA